MKNEVGQKNLVQGQDINGKPVAVVKSQPVQLELFQTFLPRDTEQYSNTIELYDAIPKYFPSRQKMERLREGGKYLPTLTRSFRHRNQDYAAKIIPARIQKKDGTEKDYYPGHRESLVEEALRKIACNRLSGVYLNDTAGVQFTLSELKRELEQLGHGIHLDNLLEALTICSRCQIQVTTSNGESVLESSIFPTLIITNRKQWLKKPKDSQCYVAFNPLVTVSINQLTYRQFNYQTYMTFRSQLAQWFHKRLSHLYLQANLLSPYTIRMSTVVRDSGLVNGSRSPDKVRQINDALKELAQKNIIMSVRLHKEYGKQRKLLEVTYTLTPGQEFVREIKKANKRQQQLESQS